MDLRHDGRVLLVTLVINTAADPYQLAKSLKRVAAGERLDAHICQLEGYTGAEGAKVWKVVQEISAKAKLQAKPPDLSNIGIRAAVASVEEGPPSIADAIVELDACTKSLLDRGMDVMHLSGLSLGAGVRSIRDAGGSREKMLEAVALLWDRKVDHIVAVADQDLGDTILPLTQDEETKA